MLQNEPRVTLPEHTNCSCGLPLKLSYKRKKWYCMNYHANQSNKAIPCCTFVQNALPEAGQARAASKEHKDAWLEDAGGPSEFLKSVFRTASLTARVPMSAEGSNPGGKGHAGKGKTPKGRSSGGKSVPFGGVAEVLRRSSC